MSIEVVDLDFSNEQHCLALTKILRTYAAEDGGGQQDVANDVLTRLPSVLSEVPGREVLLAKVDSNPAGVAVCFVGFSTFKARPVLNVHDLAALPEYRGQGVGTALLAAADQRARERGCCKVTLEVITTNDGARRLYQRCGFTNPTEDAATIFLQKEL